MQGPVDNEPVRPLPTGPTTCLGCAPPILPLPHMCGGNRIPAELGWYCVCPEPECRRRQGR